MTDTAQQISTANAVLVVDIDQSITRAVLCDVVEGLARLVDVGEAATTSGPPFFDTSVGIGQAIRRLEDQTGRRLMESEAVVSPTRPDGDGVDRIFVTGAPVPATRIGLLSLGNDSLTHVLRTAVRRTVSDLHEADEYFEWAGISHSPTGVEAWLRDARPATMILVAGNASLDNWKASLDVIASVAPELGIRQGIIVGDEERQRVAAESLDDSVELSGIDPGAYEPSEISSAVESELRDQYASSLQQEPALKSFTAGTFVDRIQGVENVAAFLHRRMGRNLAALTNQDGTFLEIASDLGAQSVYRADLDINGSARSLLQIPAADITRWVPFQMTEDEIRHWLLNRSLRPQSMLFGEYDQQVAAAAVRELVRLTTNRAGIDTDLDVDLIVLGREIMDSVGDAGVLVGLDALRPLPVDGVVMLSVDRDSIVASLGSISAGEPDYAREVIENDFLSPLASCIVFNGQSQAGNRVADIEIQTDSGDRQVLTLNYGEILQFTLPEGRTADVMVTPTSEFSVGRYAAGEAVTYSGDRTIHGGEYGIVFDGRGRPVDLPRESEARISTLKRWTQAVTAGKGQAE